MSALTLSAQQLDAVLAGLRCLQVALESGSVSPDDGDIGDILTNGQTHPGLTADEIDKLCESINSGECA